MKQLFLSLFTMGVSAYAQAQAPMIQWQKTIGGTNVEGAHYISQTTDGGYLVTGQSMSNDGDVTGGHGSYDAWTAKLSSTGSIVWQRALGCNAMDDGFVILETPEDGGSIMAGYSSANNGDVTGNHGNTDMWLVKLSATGSIMWQKSYGGSNYEEALTMIRTSDGGYMLGGYSRSSDGDATLNHGFTDCWVVKVSSTGALEWQKSYGGSGYERVASIEQTADGGYVIASPSNSNDGDVVGNHGSMDYWVFKVSSTGTIVWQKCLGGTNTDDATNLIKSSDGGYVVTGYSRSSDGDVTAHHSGPGIAGDVWTVKINATGTIVWEYSAGGFQEDYGYSIVETDDMGYVVSGHVWSADGDVAGSHGGTDFWIHKLSSAGVLQWQKPIGGSMNDGSARMCRTKDGGYVLAGQAVSSDGDVTGSTVHGSGDYWIVKLNCDYTVGSVTASASVCVGASVTLTAVTPGGIWSASNSNASVSGGVVTGIVAGVDTIGYTIINTCGSPQKYSMVTVNALPVATISVAGSTLSTTTPFVTYQWLLGGIPITGATGATHAAATPGTYAVIVTNAAGCEDTSAAFIYSTTDIQGVAGNGAIRIVPNPTNGDITITAVNAVNVRIYNYTGQLVKTVNNTNTLSVAELPAGVYLAAILDEHNNLLQQERIIKN